MIVLGEDERHARFARQYLLRLGVSGHAIRVESQPAGRGCGEQWVRQQYATQVRACRARNTRAATKLVVVIDADTNTVERRSDQLSAALHEAGLEPRHPSESVSHFIPKRSIETWILCLGGRPVDEVADLSGHRDVEAMVLSSVRTFFEWTRPNAMPPGHCVPSLLAAVPEARRLE